MSAEPTVFPLIMVVGQEFLPLHMLCVCNIVYGESSGLAAKSPAKETQELSWLKYL